MNRQDIITPKVEIERLQMMIETTLQLPKDALKSKSRVREIVDARKIFYKIGAEQLEANPLIIARFLGQDRTTGIYAKEAANELYNNDPAFNHLYTLVYSKYLAASQPKTPITHEIANTKNTPEPTTDRPRSLFYNLLQKCLLFFRKYNIGVPNNKPQPQPKF